MLRGEMIAGGPDPSVSSPYLPNTQSWASWDNQGNWAAFDETIDVTTTSETRTHNGVNEIGDRTIDGGLPGAGGGVIL